MQEGDWGPRCRGDSSLPVCQRQGHLKKGFLGHRPKAQPCVPEPSCHPCSQWGQQRPPRKSQNVGDTHTLPSPDPTVSSSEPPSPLNYLRQRVHVGQSEKQTSPQLMRCQRPRVGLVYGATVTTCEDSAPALPSPSQHDATSGPHRRSAHPGTRTHRPGTCHRWKSSSGFFFFFFLHSIRRSGGSSGVGGRTRPAHPRVRALKHPHPCENTWCQKPLTADSKLRGGRAFWQRSALTSATSLGATSIRSAARHRSTPLSALG